MSKRKACIAILLALASEEVNDKKKKKRFCSMSYWFHHLKTIELPTNVPRHLYEPAGDGFTNNREKENTSEMLYQQVKDCHVHSGFLQLEILSKI